MRKLSWVLTVLAVFLFVGLTPAYAFQIGGSPLDGIKIQDGRLAWQISKTFESMVTVDQVSSLHNDLSYGEITLIFALSDASGKSPADVLALRKDNSVTWNNVAQKLSVKLSDVSPTVSSILKNAKLDAEDNALKAQLDQESAPGAKPVVSPPAAAKMPPADQPKDAYHKDIKARQ
ncbi:MAG: hypothetical protein P4N41_25295 [Negativicutes bacterium]|nr:hypothetical protein [Negativicutes bacterium]